MLKKLTSMFGLHEGRPPQGLRLTTALLALVAALLASGSVQGGIIFTDGFEDGKKFADPTGYGGRLATIVSAGARTGTNALVFDTKEGAIYTLPDVYQQGTYTVSYYVRRETALAAHNGFLTYGITGLQAGPPVLGDVYLEEPGLPLNQYKFITFQATIAAGNPALGNNVQLMMDQSRLNTTPGVHQLRLDDLTIDFVPLGAAAVPEPASVAVSGLGALVMAWRARRRSKANA